MKITLKDQEIITAQNALEMYIAMHLGRYGDIIMHYPFRCKDDDFKQFRSREDECESYLQHIRNTLMPDMQKYPLRSANRGIFQPIVDDRARDAYDMLQCIRYVYAWHKHPEGGHTVNFYEPMIRGRYPKPECRAYDEDCVDAELCAEQMKIFCEAAQVYDHINQGRIRQAFTLYTDNTEALNTAEKIELLVPKVEDKYIKETERLLRHIQKAEGDKI